MLLLVSAESDIVHAIEELLQAIAVEIINFKIKQTGNKNLKRIAEKIGRPKECVVASQELQDALAFNTLFYEKLWTF